MKDLSKETGRGEDDGGEAGKLVELILEKYELCGRCLRRQFLETESIPDFHRLGKQGKCYICASLMDMIQDFSSKVIHSLEGYEFETFNLGTRLPAIFTEREDELRSRFKLKGGVTIKGNVTRTLRRDIREALGKEVRLRGYDLMVIADPANDVTEITLAPVFVFGRYTKKVRGVTQKARKCGGCFGKGCENCLFTGTKGTSVEEILEARMKGLFDATSARFTWFGGEDANSLVLGRGRPFIAEVISPKLRHPRTDTTDLKKEEEKVNLPELIVIEARPQAIQEFIVEVLARIRFEGLRRSNAKRAEEFFRESTVEYTPVKRGKTLRKAVKDLHFVKLGPNSGELRFACEGGLHIKQFLTGEGGYVKPSLSYVLDTRLSLDEDSPFDVLDVALKGEVR